MDSVKLLHARWLLVATLLSFVLALTFLAQYFVGERKEMAVLGLGGLFLVLGIFSFIKKSSVK